MRARTSDIEGTTLVIEARRQLIYLRDAARINWDGAVDPHTRWPYSSLQKSRADALTVDRACVLDDGAAPASSRHGVLNANIR